MTKIPLSVLLSWRLCLCRLFSSSSSSPVSQDPLAVKLCKSLLRLPEQLKQLESGRYADENEGSDVFEVNIDTWRGSVAVRQLRDIPQGLETATQEARERVADQIEKFMEDIAALEQECAVLTKKMRESEGEGCEALASHYAALQAVIGQREKELSALKRKSAVEVEVEVERMSTRVEVWSDTTQRRTAGKSVTMRAVTVWERVADMTSERSFAAAAVAS
eukprot:g53080.t1